MRPDMFEILIERPRHNSSWRARHARRGRPPRDLEDLPSREPLRMRDKHLNENLAPLERFLDRRVGRDWNDVHSEICAQLSPRSAVQKHVLDHLWRMVDRYVVLEDGQARSLKGHPWWRDDFYVCPETNRLLRTQLRPREPAPRQPLEWIRLDDQRWAWRNRGLWYRVRFAPLPPRDDRRGLRDAVYHFPLAAAEAEVTLRDRYRTDAYYAAEKRQLSKAEVKRLQQRHEGSRSR